MFVELEKFTQEKEQYNQIIKEINETVQGEEELEKKLVEAKDKYKNQVRKFLPSALNTIKTNLGSDYSIYKVGKDFNSEFKVVETNVRKTKPEVIAEMNEFKLQAESMSLPEHTISKINLAMEVFLTYSEDADELVDEDKEVYMKHAKVTNSSIVTVPTRINNAFEPITNEIQHNPYASQPLSTTEISHNPYANQPMVDTGFKNDTYDAKTPIVNPFAAIYNGTAPVQDTSIVSNDNINSQVNSVFSGQQLNPFVNEQASNNQFISMPQQNNFNIESNRESNDFSIPTVNSNMSYGDNNKFIQGSNPTVVIQPKVNNQDAGWKINSQREEKPTLKMKILAGFLIPVLSTIISIIVLKSVEVSFIQKALEKLLELTGDDLYSLIIYLIIGAITFIFSMIIIALAKTKTKHIGKFLILPSLITSSIVYFFPDILDFIIKTFKIDFGISLVIYLYTVFAIYIAEILITLLFIRIIFKKRNESSRIKWNIFEKLGFILIIYTIFIPSIYIILGLIGNMSISEVIAKLYNYEYSQYIMGGLSILFSMFIIILNRKEDKRL